MKYFLIILCVSVIQVGFSQEMKTSFSNAIFQSSFSYPLLKQNTIDPFSIKFTSQSQPTNYFAVNPIPTYNSLPSLFCKLEYKIETRSKLALRFRLGSLQYANWMEGKGEYYSRY